MKCVVEEQQIDISLNYVDTAVAKKGKINTCSKCLNAYCKKKLKSEHAAVHQNKMRTFHNLFHKYFFLVLVILN